MADASTAAANPAGMTLLDRSQQLLGASGAFLPSTNFDVAPQTTTPGGGGGNAGVFFPIGGVFTYAGSRSGFGSAWPSIPISQETSTTERHGQDDTT